MFTLKAYLNTQQERAEASVREIHQENGTVAVYVDATAKEGFLDANNGVNIELIPLVPVRRYMADYRITQHWCMPSFGSEISQIPDDTQALVLELENGEYCVVVPLINDTYKCVLQGGEDHICAVMASWCDGLQDCHGPAFVYASGKSPFALMEQCVKTAVELLGNKILLRAQRVYPENFEYLGWCSWDSMQIRVNETGILEKCQEFKDKNIPVKWAIIDDMWAEIRDFYGKTYDSFKEMVSMMHASKLYGLEADPIRFPHGLAHCVNAVKNYGLQVGIWYPTTGYWNGLDPKGPAYAKLKDHLLYSKMDRYIPSWEYDHAYAYFSYVLDFFKSCGGDFIKIDNQAVFFRQYNGFAPIGQMAEEFHRGLEDAAREQFDSRMINCMGMASENIWNRHDSPISRCSDDFLPENKSWFTKHVLQCAYNSLLQGQLYWCDWDMWWTDDGQARKNSLMRAVSGGPVYVSDMLQRSRGEILKPLALEDGRILRCDRPGMPTDDCVVLDPTTSGKAMKIQNISGDHGIMAVLNLDEQGGAVTTEISSDQIPSLDAEEYAVYEHFSGTCQMLSRGEKFTVTLKNDDDYRLYIFAPVVDGIAVIGRTDKFISPKTISAVEGTNIELLEDGPWAYVKDGKLINM